MSCERGLGAVGDARSVAGETGWGHDVQRADVLVAVVAQQVEGEGSSACRPCCRPPGLHGGVNGRLLPGQGPPLGPESIVKNCSRSARKAPCSRA